MWVSHAPAVLSHDVETAIAHAPVNLAVVALHDAVKVVVAIAEVRGEAVGEAGPLIGATIAVAVAAIATLAFWTPNAM